MESLMLRGTNASGIYSGFPGIAFCLQNIVMDLPVSGVTVAPSVTLSGAITGSYTFNDSVVVTKQFNQNEDVYVTTTNFGSNFGVIINYISTGDPSSYMQTDMSRSSGGGYSTPWRFQS
jgi:hypothetical protein